MTLPFAFGQNFSAGVSDGRSQSPMAVDLTTPIFNAPIANNNSFNQSMNVVEITHNTSNALETGFRCNGGNNSFYRDFDLAGDFGVVEDFEVLAAQFVPWFNGGPATSMDVTLNIYSTTTGTFPGGTLTLQGTTTVNVDIADNFNLLTIPVSAIIPAGESMIYEVALINDGANDQFIVANNQPQTGPSYWSSPAGGFSCNFLQQLHPSNFYEQMYDSIKSCVSLSKSIIICFIKQIYHFMKSCVLLSNFMIF